MAVTSYRRLQTQVKRLGQRATVKVHAKTGEDAFGNPGDEYTIDREVWAMRTYPDRNREIKGGAGDRQEDDPVFIVPRPNPEDPRDETPVPPDDEDRLVYDGNEYALQAPTWYATHVEYRAQRVIGQ